MSETPTLSVGMDEIAEILRGAVDLYVHPGPELLPRAVDVVTLAKQMKADGFAGAMLWNQFMATGEMAEVVTGVTGFQLYGSISLNGTVGGVNPRVTEHAIRMGARYVGMPSLSGTAAFAQISAQAYGNEALSIAGPVSVSDEDGAVLPAVHEILDLVTTYDVALGLGYLDVQEAMAVLRAAKEHGVQRIAILRPLDGFGFTEEELAEAMAISGTVIEIPASSLRSTENSGNGVLPSYADFAKGIGPVAPVFAKVIKQYGADRCVLMSDAGWNDATALQWMQLGAEALAHFGITGDQLRTMVHDTPAQLIGIE